MKQKKVPLRKCVGCEEMKPKKELIRVLKNKDGEIAVDVTGKAGGRGAYLCKSKECLSEAYKTKRLNRALESNIPEDIYSKLDEEMPNE